MSPMFMGTTVINGNVVWMTSNMNERRPQRTWQERMGRGHVKECRKGSGAARKGISFQFGLKTGRDYF